MAYLYQTASSTAMWIVSSNKKRLLTRTGTLCSPRQERSAQILESTGWKWKSEQSMMLASSILSLLTAFAFDQGGDPEGEMWKSMVGSVSARCMIEVATATNQQHLLTQETYRAGAERKAVELAGALIRHARAVDTAIYAYDRVMARQRDLLENRLITQAEYDVSAAQAPSIETIIAAMRHYPACDFYRTAYGPSVRRAREALGR